MTLRGIKLKQLIDLMKKTYTEWDRHQATRFGASVAYYTLFSIAPLLVLVAGMVGLVFSQQQAQTAIVHEVQSFIGQRGADMVQSVLKSAQKPTSGIVASTLAFVTLLFGASSVFVELREALNSMWEAPPPQGSGIWALVKDRLFSFGLVFGVGFVLLVSLLLSTMLSVMERFFGQFLPIPAPVLQAANFILSFVVIWGLFGLMYKVVPNVRIDWRDVTVGAFGTALLFTIGKFLLGIYFGFASVGSAYGAAGSLVVVIAWVYYSAQIFFFGAEFTHVYSKEYGSRARRTRASVVPNARAAAMHF